MKSRVEGLDLVQVSHLFCTFNSLKKRLIEKSDLFLEATSQNEISPFSLAVDNTIQSVAFAFGSHLRSQKNAMRLSTLKNQISSEYNFFLTGLEVSDQRRELAYSYRLQEAEVWNWNRLKTLSTKRD